MSEVKKVAVVGCGYWGKNLVRTFANLGALSGVIDSNDAVAQALAQQYSAKAMTFEEVLMAKDIDAVAIALPAEFHAEYALKAFAHKKHVFVEKPIALSVEEGLAMKAASDASGCVLMVGHLLRYHPAFCALKDLVDRGELGKLRYLYSNRLSLGKFRLEENVLWSFAPHDLSMLLALIGEAPSKVHRSGGAFVTDGVQDEARLDLDFASGVRAHVFVSWLHPFKEQRLVVVGDKAMAVFEDSLPGADKLRLYRHEIALGASAPVPTKSDAEPIPYDTGEPLTRECEHFLDCVATGRNPVTDAEEALRVLSVMTV